MAAMEGMSEKAQVAHVQASDVELEGGRQSKKQIMESQTFPFVGVEESEGAEEEKQEQEQEEDYAKSLQQGFDRERMKT